MPYFPSSLARPPSPCRPFSTLRARCGRFFSSCGTLAMSSGAYFCPATHPSRTCLIRMELNAARVMRAAGRPWWTRSASGGPQPRPRHARSLRVRCPLREADRLSPPHPLYPLAHPPRFLSLPSGRRSGWSPYCAFCTPRSAASHVLLTCALTALAPDPSLFADSAMPSPAWRSSPGAVKSRLL